VSTPRICVVSANFHPFVGGLESQALSHVRGLRQRGYSVTILTLRHSRDWPAHEQLAGAGVVRVAGIPLALRAHLPGIARRPLYFFSVLALAGALWRYRRQYDIAHVYQLTILATLCALVCLFSRKRLVVAVRSIGANLVAPAPLRHASARSPATDGKSRTVASGPAGGDLAQLWQFGMPTVWLTCKLLRRVGAVVLVLSTRSMPHLAAFELSGLPMVLLPNGVDTERFTPSPASVASSAERARTVVCVARLVPAKGIETLLRAWRLVRERTAEVRLLLVGDGPLMPALQHLAEDLDVQACVEFVGERPDARPYLRRAGVAVLSSYAEGLSNALLEAMACGLPCVATRISGSEDVIQHEVNGLLVEPGDVSALAGALLRLLSDPALAERYGHAARATIEAHYSRERILAQHMDLYRQLMDASPRPSRLELSLSR
jgi:glycosyltransferase involved in cell wall biosynthesis